MSLRIIVGALAAWCLFVPLPASGQQPVACELRKKINAGVGDAITFEKCSSKTAKDIEDAFSPASFFPNFCAEKLACANRLCQIPQPGDRCLVDMLETPTKQNIKCKEVPDDFADCELEGDKKFECTVRITEGKLRCGCKCEHFVP